MKSSTVNLTLMPRWMKKIGYDLMKRFSSKNNKCYKLWCKRILSFPDSGSVKPIYMLWFGLT